MASIVKSRNHYETLGIEPGASGDEIERAFLREINAPRAFGGLAEVGAAHATLRDPAKRSAYDASLGLIAAAQPRYAPTAVAGRGSAHFMQLAMSGIGAEAVEPHVESRPRPETPPQRGPEQFIAASARVDLPSAPPARPQQAERQHRPPPRAAPSLEQLIGQLDAVRQPGVPIANDAGGRWAGWSRTAAIAGVLVVATMLLGAWAGLSARDGEEPQPAATIKLAPPRPLASADSPVAPTGMAQTVPQQTAPVLAAAPRIRRNAAPRRPASSGERLAEISRSLESLDTATAPEESASAQPAAEAPPVVAAAATLPLSQAVIARTIGRIGYACGRVASTTAVEGGTGAFNVTCTSGQTYRAARVGGRYRFRRIGGR